MLLITVKKITVSVSEVMIGGFCVEFESRISNAKSVRKFVKNCKLIVHNLSESLIQKGIYNTTRSHFLIHSMLVGGQSAAVATLYTPSYSL